MNKFEDYTGMIKLDLAVGVKIVCEDHQNRDSELNLLCHFSSLHLH